jgi:aminoglycoside 6-adenylyltransferase
MNKNDKLEYINNSISELIKNNEDIKAVLSVGSLQQGAGDEYSDMDLFIFTTKAKKYIDNNDSSWADNIGRIMSRVVIRETSVYKNKIILDNGITYDFAIVGVNRLKAIKMYFSFKKRRVLSVFPNFLKNSIEQVMFRFFAFIKRGYKIHYDQIELDVLLKNITDFSAKKDDNAIDYESFYKSYQLFWHVSYDAAIKLIRGDFYFNVILYDHFLRKELSRMIEWKILSEKKVDVFYNARRIESWAGKEISDKLFKTLPHTDILQTLEALLYTTNLFREFSDELAEKYQYNLNKELENFVTGFIKNTAIAKELYKVK